ncbi:MAG: hydrolase, TatD family [Anaeromyxobacteraceae bacterium]|nr:hydrolase, TatD family [Anaeromyxobacteraceae bacterium]
MSLIDSHAHLDFEDFQGDIDGVVSRAAAVGVDRIIVVGLWRSPGNFGNALELARARPAVFAATAGIHPHECAQVPEADWEESARLAADPLVVGVGETGLDYHYDLSPRDVQRESFRRSIRIARDVDKPLVVHVREAHDACAAILREEGIPTAGGVIHCFTGDWAAARVYLDLGMHVSVAGIVTFKAAEEIREAVRRIPRERLLVETDSPFLAPVPFRGKRNEPAHVVHVASKVAELWGVSPAEVAEITTGNVKRLFRLR